MCVYMFALCYFRVCLAFNVLLTFHYIPKYYTCRFIRVGVVEFQIRLESAATCGH